MSDFCDASFRDLPSEIFCMIVFIWFSEIVLFSISSSISSSLSVSILFCGWYDVSILATRFGLLCSWIRSLKSSTLFFFRISFISSGLSPNSSKYDLCSEVSLGRFFFVSSMSCL